MKRKIPIKQKQVDAIICSDLHLTEQTPVCRTDDYIQAQRHKLEFIKILQYKYQCPVLCAGDIFDHWKPSPWLISFALKYLPDELIAIPGQHDLPQHNLDLIEKSGFNALIESGRIEYLCNENAICLNKSIGDIYLTPFGQEIEEVCGTEIYTESGYKKLNNILMLHQLTWQKEPWPGAPPEGNARKLLKENPDFDLIITGDNHQAFTEEYKGRLLVNPGSIMRSTAKQIDFQPRVYLWNAESNTVQIEYLPIQKDAVTRLHLDIKEERTNRLDSFIELIQKIHPEMKGHSVSFEENIKQVLKSTKIAQNVKDKVLEAVGL